MRWKWHVRTGTIATNNYQTNGIFLSIDDAYACAEKHAKYRFATILLESSTGLAVADTREIGGSWVVGKESWKETERKAVEAGRV